MLLPWLSSESIGVGSMTVIFHSDEMSLVNYSKSSEGLTNSPGLSLLDIFLFGHDRRLNWCLN